ncbi:hypothetical protein EDB80DRAFT_869462 [Ilyonectria destructans]|nr:hypothetical protein EDB80DRAFT_869462 [Ilyonectria destructans]
MTYIELGLLATVNLQGGIFQVKTHLSLSHWRLCYILLVQGSQWAFEGYWICTIGGYHRAIDLPKHYPGPHHLHISSWGYKKLSVPGDAWFAIKPNVCIVHMNASLSMGLLRAWVETYTNSPIKFTPPSFQAV